MKPYSDGSGLALLAALMAVSLVGSATGVQRVVLPARLIGLGLALPIVAFGVSKSLIEVVSGVVADEVGRRASSIIGVLAYVGGAWLLYNMPTSGGATLANLLIGAGEGLLFTAMAVAVSDLLGAREAAKALGLMEAFAYSGYGVGAILAGILWQRGSLNTVLMYTVIAPTAALIVLLTMFRETRQLIRREETFEGQPISLPQAYSLMLSKPSLTTALATAHLSKLVDTSVWALLPPHLMRIGLDIGGVGLVTGAFLVLWGVAMPCWGTLSDRVGRKTMIASSLGLSALLMLWLSESRGPLDSALISAGLGITYGAQYPVLSALAVDLSPPEARGRALGLYRGIRDLGYMTGAIIVTAGSYPLAAALTAIAALLVVGVVRETRPAWPFMKLVLQHFSIMRECIEAHTRVLQKLMEGDYRGAFNEDRRLKELERLGDKIKREIMERIWSSPLPLADRMDFERLVERLDKIGGALLEADEKLFTVLPRLKREFLVEILSMEKEVMKLADKFAENLEALTVSPIYALKLTGDVEQGETRIDALRRALVRKIMREAESGSIDLLTSFELRDVVDLIELIADDLEDASDIVRIICYKHVA
ncbi:MAG: hypothetical protein DRK00_02290 [Thermoprotei archaeon]|nr:MAG: hypothetical protein DRK00_02290 [Thermoprotei archaeon]